MTKFPNIDTREKEVLLKSVEKLLADPIFEKPGFNRLYKKLSGRNHVSCLAEDRKENCDEEQALRFTINLAMVDRTVLQAEKTCLNGIYKKAVGKDNPVWENRGKKFESCL